MDTINRELLPPITSDLLAEQKRLICIDRLEVLDSPAEAAFDRITRLVSLIIGVPFATVTFIDGHRQWFMSQVGLETTETPRSVAFCSYVLQNPTPLIVCDAQNDSRFVNNPLVLGPPFLRFYAGFPVFDSEGVCVATLCAMDTQPRQLSDTDMRVMSEFADAVSDLLEFRRLATVDPLTGATNRRGFLEEGSRGLALALRHRLPFSVMVFDLDHFKSVNDDFGHDAGDEILRRTVNSCRRAIRSTDIIGRLGGEEFAVLLPLTDGTSASATAERIRREIEGQVANAEALPAVTASFGIAESTGDVFTIEQLIARADDALYQAKNAGRNCCMMSTERTAAHPKGRRVLKAGKVVFNGGKSVIDCTVRRFSDLGATVYVSSPAGIPDSFKLRIEVDGFSRMCHVINASGECLQLEFR